MDTHSGMGYGWRQEKPMGESPQQQRQPWGSEAGELVDLSRVLDSQRLDADRFTANFPTGWQQGRGAFGGLVMGTLARAMTEFLGSPERLLRTISGEIVGPVQPGAAELRIELLRASSAVSTVSARLLQGGELQAHAVALFGKSRVSDREWSLDRPQPPALESVLPLVALSPDPTHFGRHFEFRVLGSLPFSGTGEPVTSGWVRPHVAGDGLGPCELVALVDAWWPAAFNLERTLRPMATLSFTAQLLAPPTPLPAERPLFYRARDLGARDGFVSELRELWDDDGHLLVVNQQTFVFIK